MQVTQTRWRAVEASQGGRPQLRASIKRLLRTYRYPPDKRPEAIVNIMQQMEAMAPRLAEEGLR